MRDASPAFQPDRDGSPGFQLAEDAGFQTQTPAVVGAAGVVVGGSATTSLYSPEHEYAGRAGVVIGCTARTRGPRRAASGGLVYTMPVHRRYEGRAGVVVGCTARTALSPAPIPEPPRPAARRYVVVGRAAVRVGAHARTDALDYVRDVLEPETEELLLLV